uniref:Putative secreted protein n=1 Tax=Anopheles darlingi TaxID=43151 RepID=A0A2M4D1I4_ANODA
MFKLSTITKFFNFICLCFLLCLQSSQLTQRPLLLFSPWGFTHRTSQRERDQSNIRTRCSRGKLWDISTRNALSSHIYPISHRFRALSGAHR